jgi:hypothetical protein
MTKADKALTGALKTLGLSSSSAKEKYERVDDIVAELDLLNTAAKFSPGTTGALSERLCELALLWVMDARPKVSYKRLATNWKWLGDFVVRGNPYDITVSVKSFKARERLLASGTGSVLAPTIGWGLFNSAEEWSESRVRSHLYRGFVAIYMPGALLNALTQQALDVTNINGRPLVRTLGSFPTDLLAALPSPSSENLDMRLL